MDKKLLCIISLLLFLPFNAKAQNFGNESNQTIRVAGDFIVSSLQPSYQGGFSVTFRSELPTSRFNTLKLSTDHVHASIQVGQKIRLSAEVSEDEGQKAEVSQVVIFVPTEMGSASVWLMSNRNFPVDLQPVSFLKMHSPQTDFLIM